MVATWAAQFRDRAVAASLKRIGRDRPEYRILQFRDRAVAASLKRAGCSLYRRVIIIPRPRGRGLIEAMWPVRRHQR